MQILLNERQKEAVEYRGGPLLIIAGAGTGKTAVITKRIVNLINSKDAKPNEILALTFTEKAAKEMIERVDVELPLGYEEIKISTFHSFCDSVLRQYGGYIGLDTGFSLMTQAQSYIFFRKHLFDLPLDNLRPVGNPRENINHILRLFSRLHDEDVTPEEYLNYASTHPSEKVEEEDSKGDAMELAKVYEAYTNLKIAESKLDFGDLITQTLRLFRSKPAILKKYRDRFKYILVDEFQDTNYTQSVLVNVMALGVDYQNASDEDRSRAEVTVVGDDDQAIYKFRGAAISNILHFNTIYPSAKKIVLTENYRSKQEILNAAYQLIQKNNPDRLEISEDIEKRLISKVESSDDSSAVTLLIGDSDDEEADLVAKQILKLTGNQDKLKNDNSIVDKQFDKEGQGMFVDIDDTDGEFKFSDIAILVRAHSHSEQFVQILKYYGIPFKFGGARGLYSRPEVSFLLSYLKVLADYQDDISMFNILKHSIWGLTPRDRIEIQQLAMKDKISQFELLEKSWGIRLGDVSENDIREAELPNIIKSSISESSLSRITDLLVIINQGIKYLHNNNTIGETLFSFFKDSGYMDQLLKEDDPQNIFKVQNISKYFDLLKDYEQNNSGTTIALYVEYLKYSMEIGESPSIDLDSLESYDAVNIMTVHGAKGLEFPVVFLVNLVAQRFPTRNMGDTFPIPDPLIKDIIPDVDSSTENLREERRLFYVGATRAKQKLYLTAAKRYRDGKSLKKPSIFLDEILNRKVSEDFTDKESNGLKPKFALTMSSDDDYAELEGLDGIAPLYISYSHIDTYLTCPKKYLYRYVYRIPTPAASALTFGRSIHTTLMKFYKLQKDYIEGLEGITAPPSLDDLLQIYEKEWDSKGYENARHERFRKDHGKEMLKEFYETGYSPKDRPIALEHQFKYKLDDVIIKGSIDRIDLLEDGDIPKVEVIDYKTGKVGKKADAEKNLQLAIYSLIAKSSLGYQVSKASLIYVEHGVKISVDIPEEKIEIVKNQVSRVMEGIRSVDFTASPGFHCKFCEYREICEDAMV